MAYPIGSKSMSLSIVKDPEDLREAILFVPFRMPAGPFPLHVLFHAASNPGQVLGSFQDHAYAHGVIVLATKSRGYTWDIISGSFGEDVRMIDRLLFETVRYFDIDRKRVSVDGFSDGASYALSLGLANGSIFSSILAFSTGFVAPGPRTVKPKVFLTHGTSDKVLPIDVCGRGIASYLRANGYVMQWKEFDRGHVVVDEIAAKAYATLRV